jgi:hypothetical protein
MGSGDFSMREVTLELMAEVRGEEILLPFAFGLCGTKLPVPTDFGPAVDFSTGNSIS